MSNLKNNGYARYDLMQQLNYEGIEADYQTLLNYFDNLPADEYAKGLNRYRRYSRALVLPSSSQIEWLPTLTKTERSTLRTSKVNLIQSIQDLIVNLLVLIKKYKQINY